MNDAPQITRVRHELRRRALQVAAVERFAPSMIRVRLRGAELAGFTSTGFDDHIKVFFPAGGADTSTTALGPAMRDFTPRRYDSATGELWVDFFLHGAGPASSWAAQAAVGQRLEIGGPKGSALIALQGIEAHVLIGDETALPAIGRRLEELPGGTPVVVVIETQDGARPELPPTTASLEVVCVARSPGLAPAGQSLIDRLRALSLPAGRCFHWVALESRAARAIRSYLRDERGIDKRWIKASGYWQQGSPGTHEHLADG